MIFINYYFDVSFDVFEGVLDRFLGFFFEFLFNEVRSFLGVKNVKFDRK